MIVLDASVLVYAVGDSHPLRDGCRAIVRAVKDGEVAATTTIEAIQEFAHVRARRRDRSDAAAYARDFIALLSPLVVLGTADLESGMRLFERHERLGSFDAVLAAATLARGAQALVSADRAFGSVSGLVVVVPDEPGTAALLGSTGR